MWKSGNSFYTRVYSRLDALTALIYFPCWFLTVSLELFHKSTRSTTLHSHYSTLSKLASKPFNPLTICRLCLGKFVRTRIIHRNSQWSDQGFGFYPRLKTSAVTVVRSPQCLGSSLTLFLTVHKHAAVLLLLISCCSASLNPSRKKKKERERVDWKTNSSEMRCQQHGCHGFH